MYVAHAKGIRRKTDTKTYLKFWFLVIVSIELRSASQQRRFDVIMTFLLRRVSAGKQISTIIFSILFEICEAYCFPRHPMMTSWNGNIFRVTRHLCGEFTGPRWIPHTKASDAELWRFDLRLNKQLSKQSWGWWFETLSRPLWRHCDA